MACEWCKHYAGTVMSGQCRAGVKYADLETFGTMDFFSSACFDRKAAQVCKLAEYPTKEEMEQEDRETEERFAKMIKARHAIVEHLGGPWKRGTSGARGVIECPVCGGELAFSRSGYNGHIHASCSKEDCVRWME